MNIKEEIQKLVELQKIDSELFDLRRQRDVEIPSRTEALKQEFESKKIILSNLEADFKNIQVKKKEREVDLQAKEDTARKANAQLYQLKTNKEYQLKTKEIESIKADVSVIEEDILKMMEETDVKTRELKENKDKIAGVEKEFKEQAAKIEEEIKKLDIEFKGLWDKRSIISKDVNPEILTQYEHLLENKHGRALVPLKDGSCGGCFMHLPPEIINRCKQYSQIVRCEMCARMLYLAEDFSA